LTPTETDYWRDAVAMAVVDKLPSKTIWIALRLAKRGNDFNAAIWAADR